jgi:NADP-dependent 3-hydroxy acid dehydrogenase YdfG
VTGASTGIGAKVVERLAAAGLEVHAIARDERRLAELAERTGAIPHVLDLGDTGALEELLPSLDIDVLANIAGVSRMGNVLDATREDIDSLVDINLTAVLHLVRLILPGMVARDSGHIVNISSIAGHYNFFGHTAYHATKAAVHQLSRQIRNDVLGKRIRVTEVSPGRVETEIFARNLGGSPEAIAEAHATYFEGYESLTTDDVANAIEFALHSPQHMNVGLIEIMPTFQVPGGLTFDRH